jgi:uncharacterized protein (TIGR03435 family)
MLKRSRFVAAAAFLALAFASSILVAQSPEFEVASIKTNKTIATTRGLGIPADRLTVTALTLHQMIAYAFGSVGQGMQLLLDEQIAGEEPWMNTDRFDINAKAPSDTPVGIPGFGQKLLMLRQLLTERFKLAMHHETRTAPVYVLTIARADGRLGADMHPSDVDCAALAAARAGGPPTAPAPGAGPACGEMLGSGGASARFRAGAEHMATLAMFLSRMTNRPVIDRTGLTGAFDIDIEFDAAGLEGMPRAPAPVGPGADAPLVAAPSLFATLQDRLGLKLTSDRGPLDVLVIDHAEHPTEN